MPQTKHLFGFDITLVIHRDGRLSVPVKVYALGRKTRDIVSALFPIPDGKLKWTRQKKHRWLLDRSQVDWLVRRLEETGLYPKYQTQFK